MVDGGLFGKRQLDVEISQDFEVSKKSKLGASARFLAETKSESQDGAAKRRLRRTVSKEELAKITSVRCEDVPDHINKSDILSEHFSKFGQLVKVVSITKKKTAVIHFTDHSSAKAAKSKGKFVDAFDETIGNIIYSQSSPSRLKRKANNLESDDSSNVHDIPDDIFGQNLPKLPMKKSLKMTKPFQQQQTEEKAKVDFNASKDASQAELLRIMKQQAGSDEDRWKILDARDKYLKLKYPKTQLRSGLEIEDMDLIGTCPDLCPEKER